MHAPHPVLSRFLLLLLLTLLCFVPTASRAQTFQARNVTLLSHLDQYGEYTNSWQYIHPDGREYVLLGTRFGLSIVRLTDPSHPVEVGFIPGLSCLTRDADQYLTYVYVLASICRNGEPGLQIISMADPDHPVLVNTTHLVDSAENVTIDPARALLFTSETNVNSFDGGLHILSLADPVNPVELSATSSYEVHDFTALGNVGFGSDISTGTLHVIDITNPSAPFDISSLFTGGPVHSFAPTDDGRFLYVTFENALGATPGGYVSIYDMRNLSQLSLVSTLNLTPGATTHYGRILHNRAFFANYTAGVRVWDISNSSWPAEAGYLDTWSGDDLTLDGVYDMSPYYPSGIATATDRELGLFVFRAQSTYGIVRGTVSSGKGPLAGATVRALPEGLATTTDASGRFALAPTPGPGTIEATFFGYGTRTASVSVAQGSDQTVNFSLPKLAKGTVKGTVVQASDQTGVEVAEVTGVGTPLQTLTSMRGAYTLDAVPEGTISVHVERPGFVPKTASTVVTAKMTSTLDFALQRAIFYDDAQVDRGWTIGAPDDDAVEGRWIRAVPVGTTDENGLPAQPGKDHTPAPGSVCFVTGNGPMNGDSFSSDVDGGKTTLISPPLSLGSVVDPRIVYWRWFYTNNVFVGPRANAFVTDISNDNGVTWTLVSTNRGPHNSWERVEVRVADFFPTPGTVRIRFIARDVGLGPFSVIEAAIDDFEYYSGADVTASASPAAARLDALEASPAIQITPYGKRGERSFHLSLARAGHADVRLFDVNGRLVRTLLDENLAAGIRSLTWDGRTETGQEAAGGVYFLRATAEDERVRMKVVLIR